MLSRAVASRLQVATGRAPRGRQGPQGSGKPEARSKPNVDRRCAEGSAVGQVAAIPESWAGARQNCPPSARDSSVRLLAAGWAAGWAGGSLCWLG